MRFARTVTFMVWILIAVWAVPAQQNQSDDKSLQEIRAKAEKGDAGAQFDLACRYHIGNGIQQNHAEAVKWYRRCAEQGWGIAQFFVGQAFAHGEGVPKDSAEAVKWYKKAAEQGFDGAEANLAACYAKGDGVPRSMSEAAKWYRKAAERGDEGAQVRLGLCYFNGDGLEKNAREAVTWFRKAAEQGNGKAQSYLAYCYAVGDGTPSDYVEAHRWANLAAAQGSQDGQELRQRMEERMTALQIAEAQRLAREFTPTKAKQPTQGAPSRSAKESHISSTGTGFFITDDGFLITNAHVVKNAAEIRIRTRSGTQKAVLRKVDSANDLALLSVEGQFLALPLVNSRNVRVGNTVATVGFPNVDLQGLAPKLAKGEIAAVSGAMDDPRYFQISVPVQPGNSGGALVDTAGNVVGVIAAKLSLDAAILTSGALPENVNYAVKSSFLLGFLESEPELSPKLKQPLRASRPFEDVVKSVQEATALVLVY